MTRYGWTTAQMTPPSAAVGLFFYFVITPGLLRDLAEDHATAE